MLGGQISPNEGEDQRLCVLVALHKLGRTANRDRQPEARLAPRRLCAENKVVHGRGWRLLEGHARRRILAQLGDGALGK
jgi:hypothetical protein